MTIVWGRWRALRGTCSRLFRPESTARNSGKTGKLAQLLGTPFATVTGMDTIETLRLDVHEGRIGADRLVDLLASQQRLLQTTQQQLQSTQQQLQAANDRIEVLEKKLGGQVPTTKLDEPFSVRSEGQRKEARGKKRQHQGKRKGRRGRIT